MKYKHTVMGGTFDRLHAGHISNLRTAFGNSERVTIGLTTEALHADKVLSSIIRPFDERKRSLMDYVGDNWPNTPVTVVAISDIYGPSIIDPQFDSLVVTKETYKNGGKINDVRRENGLKELAIVTAPWLVAEDGGMLSSTRIRMGEIDREGAVYRSLFEKTLRLPDSLRSEFKKPPGHVVPTEVEAISHLTQLNPTMVITVGDIVSSSLEEAGFTPHIKIIDHKTQRRILQHTVSKYNVKNDPGTISREAAFHIESVIKHILEGQSTRTISVDGEEDLLVPPSILLAPLGSVVLHGQAGEGIVVTQVTEEKKSYIKSLLQQFWSDARRL